MTNWKEKTCEKCRFVVDDYCRRTPYLYKVWVFNVVPMVGETTPRAIKKYNQACAEFKQKEKDND
jgi:hypothetical protein